jgi:hypothetical protein
MAVLGSTVDEYPPPPFCARLTFRVVYLPLATHYFLFASVISMILYLIAFHANIDLKLRFAA